MANLGRTSSDIIFLKSSCEGATSTSTALKESPLIVTETRGARTWPGKIEVVRGGLPTEGEYIRRRGHDQRADADCVRPHLSTHIWETSKSYRKLPHQFFLERVLFEKHASVDHAMSSACASWDSILPEASSPAAAFFGARAFREDPCGHRLARAATPDLSSPLLAVSAR